MTLLGAILAFVPSVNATGGWETFSPRPEISPDFQFLKRGADGKGGWLIRQGNQMGKWVHGVKPIQSLEVVLSNRCPVSW